MNELTTAVLLIILGWLFGLLSPIILNYNARIREKNEVYVALQVELTELKYRLACIVYRVNMHNGTVTREHLEWLKPIFNNYTGINPSTKILESISMQLSLTDDQIQNIANHDKADYDESLTLKKFQVPLLETKYALLSSFNTKLQNKLIELRTNLNMLNEEVDQARYFHNLMFDSTLSGGNRKIIKSNLNKTYIQFSRAAKKIVNQIDTISWP